MPRPPRAPSPRWPSSASSSRSSSWASAGHLSVSQQGGCVMPDVVVEGLTKRFGANTVLDDVGFTAHAGELFTLLGPSGCGKTTTLLSVAGFLSPDAGTIRCGEEGLLDRATRTNVPAERRDLGMVFQSYAVWPHMTVADNVAFPLRVRKLGREQRR